MRAGLFLFLALVAAAGAQQTPRDPADVLAKTRDRLRDTMERLPNYTCVQIVDRQYFQPTNPAPNRSCDQIGGDKKRGKYKVELYMKDRLRLDVKVSEGLEIGAWAGSKQFDSRSIMELGKGGSFGTGSLGGFIVDIFQNEGARFQYAGERQTNNSTLLEYAYQVPVESSHYLIEGGRQWRTTAFDGAAWIDPQSFELKRLTVQSGELPPETLTCESNTTMDYERVRLGGADYLVPRQTTLHVLMRDGRETESTTKYASCREYRGESTIHFDDVPEPAAGQKADPHAALAVPSGVSFTIALSAPVDTGTAAAGDAVVARVRKPVLAAGSKEIVMRAGATVRGRIVRMQHWVGREARFEVSIVLETLEVGGASSPLHAVWDRREEFERIKNTGGMRMRASIWMPPSGLPPTFATFVFPTLKNSYIVPRGYESKWLTIASP
jgi:hypothetical protein